MPTWLQRQLQKAFVEKNLRQIRLLNQCWFFYRQKVLPGTSDDTLIK